MIERHITYGLISSKQTVYMKNSCISENGRLTYDVLETAIILNKKGILVILGIEKTFDSIGHSILLAALHKYVFE